MDVDASQQARPPSLPTEIVHRIIQLALPDRVSFRMFRKRYDTLLGFMLVDKRWMELARRELVRHVLLKSEEQVQAFLGLMERLRIEGRPVDSLWIDEQPSSANKATFLALESTTASIKACGPLRMLHIKSNPYNRAVFDLSVVDATELRTLAIKFVNLHSPSSRFYFPSLRRLALLQDSDHLVHFLARCHIPQIEDLAVMSDFGDPPDAILALESVLQRFASRLRSLAFSDASDSPSFGFWVHLISLKDLMLDSNSNFPSIFALLPCRPTCLRIRPALADPSVDNIWGLQDLAASLLESTTPCLLDLKELTVVQAFASSGAALFDEREREQRRDWERQMERLRVVCVRGGITLRKTVSISGDLLDYIEDSM